jgi:hypothetical protein
MRARALVVAVSIGLLAGACGTDEIPTEQTSISRTGAESPELAVSAIIRGLRQDDDAMLGDATLSDQLGLLALVEGASTGDASAALGFASQQVAARFWKSFADGISDFIESGVEGIRIGEVAVVDVPGARYATVEVAFPLDSADRVFVVTERDGWKVDLVATFPGAFVSSFPFAVERASSPGVNPELLASLVRQATSLDALEAIGVDDRTAAAIAEARTELGVSTAPTG